MTAMLAPSLTLALWAMWEQHVEMTAEIDINTENVRMDKGIYEI
jgi:hypothetical protein